MTDQATPNLPSRDFDSTAAFYERLGFGIVFRDAGWMILQRGDLMLEFFAHPGIPASLKPWTPMLAKATKQTMNDPLLHMGRFEYFNCHLG